MNDPGTPTPSAPVHAARLSQLLKSLANAESSVAEIIKSRQALMEGLEKMLESNRIALSRDTALLTQMGERKADTEARKRDVEDAIMRGLAAEDSSPSATENNNSSNNNIGGRTDGSGEDNLGRPNVEALTPPPVESLTPTESPMQEQQFGDSAQAPQPHPFTLSDHSMDLSPDMQDSFLSHDGAADGDESLNGTH